MINQITTVRLPDGTDVGMVDWSDRPRFSMTEFLSGFTDLETFGFTYVASKEVAATENLVTAGGLREATLVDTNVDSSGESPATQEFIGYAMCFETFQVLFSAQAPTTRSVAAPGLPIPTGPNLSILGKRIIAGLEVSKKDFPQASFSWFTTGFGPFVVAAGVPAAFRTYGNPGLQSRDAVYFQSIPYHIGGTEKFKLIYSNPTGEAVDFVTDAGVVDATAIIQNRAYLVGYQKRATS